MPSWPLKNKQKEIPTNNHPGSFWEDRGDRHHCGIDLYSDVESDVFAIEPGIVIETGLMTSPEWIHYWNHTYFVIIKNDHGNYWKYGELKEIYVKSGENISEGQKIGKVGLVLDSEKINETSPAYIQKLKGKNPSMLHLELYSYEPISRHEKYLGGNWFSDEMPDQLLDPTEKLASI
ncbi:MAG: M23 family metallopeptidase [Candidatus Marinimicrobia bacterium]|nr:M23 family metallopeptidase [Candidatus Neomarinimicrobiota bacterium]